MDFRNNFISGKMELDVNSRLLNQGAYRLAENIRIINSEGSDVGSIEKSLSNEQLTFLELGDNVISVGKLEDEFDEKIYWAVKSDLGCFIYEYNTLTNTPTLILSDTRLGAANVLNFNVSKRLDMVLIIDSDNNNRILLFTDDNSQPKCINVDRAATYAVNGFDEEEILLVKKPPLDAPTIILSNTVSEVENNILDKFIAFSYRYKYLDGELSALAPFSEIAFLPKTFDYNFATGDNESMENAFNKVQVSINTGSKLVTHVEVVFKASGSNNINIVESFKKTDKTWLDNETQTIDFINNKVYRILPIKELYRLYDNVPLRAKAISVINNRIIFGNYTENYNLVDDLGEHIYFDFDVALKATAIVAGTPTKSMKSNRDIEIGVSYLDDYGRLTTPQTSENNTVYIPEQNSLTQNQIEVTIKNKAPEFAKKYRFFIKQTKTDYESIVPTLFYEDGAYRWVKLENSDKDKVKEGDILVVKVDSTGQATSLIYVKVLEVAEKEKNFISNIINVAGETEPIISEESGLYFKIKPSGFRMNRDDFTIASHEITHKSDQDNILTNRIAIIENAIYQGLNATNNDLTSSGTYSGSVDVRYLVQIDSLGDGTTTFNTFKWSKDNGTTWEVETVAITEGVSQVLDNGVEITFVSNYNHALTDNWVISGKITMPLDNSKAYGIYPSVTGDSIIAGARITLVYDEFGDGNDIDVFPNSFQASQNYANLEEWFYGDSIFDSLSPLLASQIYFRRGITTEVYAIDGSSRWIWAQDVTGVMTMLIISQGTQNSSLDNRAKVRSAIEIFQIENTLLFETKPKDENTDIFYEIGRTYDIDSERNHLAYNAGDVSQSVGVDAVIVLPVFNCFSWGNTFESYKIKDLFNANTMKFDTRPSTPIENYRQNKRIASLTYSNVYEQTTNYNGINEFNLGLENFKNLDDKYGPINKIISINTNIDVWQEDKVHMIFVEKTLIYNSDGSSNIGKSEKVLDVAKAYKGEYGISDNAEGVVVYGNYIYWPDVKRGVFLRKGHSGIEVISKHGIKDWTRDNFRDGDTSKILGGYDPYFEQFIASFNGKTLTFDEKVTGWTSFHSWIPDEIIRIKNRLYTVKEGQLYLHNSINNGYNNFYGEQFASEITTNFNQESQTDKIYKNIVLESLLPWEVSLKTNLTEGTVKDTEFNQHGSKWFSYLRKNENDNDLKGTSQGVGNCIRYSGNSIYFKQVPNILNTGDVLYQMNGIQKEIIGVIKSKTSTVITVDAIQNTPITNAFCFSKKDSRIEGAEIRGYYLEVTLKDYTSNANELFAVSTRVVKSFI